MAKIKLTQDFKEFLRLLDSAKIEYLLIGGYAVGLYGYERPTKDIDIWVACDPSSQQRLGEVLVRFGFPPASIRQPLFQGDQTVLRIGNPPNRLELISQIAGVHFQQCYQRRRMMQIEDLLVSVIDYDDLLKNKRSTGRTGDIADVERLEKRRQRP